MLMCESLYHCCFQSPAPSLPPKQQKHILEQQQKPPTNTSFLKDLSPYDPAFKNSLNPVFSSRYLKQLNCDYLTLGRFSCMLREQTCEHAPQQIVLCLVDVTLRAYFMPTYDVACTLCIGR